MTPGAETVASGHCPNCGCELHRRAPVTVGNVAVIDLGKVVFRDTLLRLPRCQHVLAEALIRASGRALTRGYLADSLGGDINDDTIPKYVERTRAAFTRLDPGFDQIEAVRGFGAYRWIAKAAAPLSGVPEQADQGEPAPMRCGLNWRAGARYSGR